MRRASLLLLLLPLVACATAQPQSPLAAFRYRADRVPAGKVLHYVKSNLDGSKPALVSVYVVDGNDIEVSKSEEGVSDSADITAHLDWKRFTADHLDSGVLNRDGSRERRVTLDVNGDDVLVSLGDSDQRLTVKTYPLVIYNFDLMGLNLMLPHLRDPRAGFTVAFIEPTFREGSDLVTFRGRATATYVGSETLHGVNVNRYDMTGAGLLGAHATFWINADDGFIEKVESPLPNNPDWDSYRLERRGRPLPMSREEWNAFKRSHIGVGARAIL